MAVLRPGEFCRMELEALEASEGRRKRRKRDQTPDAIGLGIRRGVLERAVADDPEPEAFEGWLLGEALAAPGSGSTRALCIQIWDEYRLAAVDRAFKQWLAAGAPSDDRAERTPAQDAVADRLRWMTDSRPDS